MRTQAVGIPRWLVGALMAMGLATALATAGETPAAGKGCPFLVPRDKVQVEIAKIRFSEQIVSEEGQKVEVPKNRRPLFRYAIITLKVKKPAGERLLMPLAGLTLHYFHGNEPDVCPCEASSAFTLAQDDPQRALKFPWEGPRWPQQTTNPKATEADTVYIDCVYPMMETDTKECWITMPEPTSAQPFIVEGWKGATAPEPTGSEPEPKRPAPSDKKTCPILGMGNGVTVDIARVSFTDLLVGIDGNERRIADDQRKNVFRYGIVTLRIRKPAGQRFTLAAADLTLHYNRAEASDWAPCDGLSTYTRSIEADRLMKLQDSQGPGWMKQTTNPASTEASEVYVDALFPSVEKDVKEIWLCVSTPTSKQPFVCEGWQPAAKPVGTAE